jgi:tight adherence protein C
VDAADHGVGRVSASLGLVAAAAVMIVCWIQRPPPARALDLVPKRTVRAAWPSSPKAVRLALGAAAAASAFVVVPVLAPLAGLAAWAAPVWRARRRRREHAAAAGRVLPEVVDLFSVAVGAGLTVPLAVAAVGGRAPEPFASAFGSVTSAVACGRRCSDAIDEVVEVLGADARPLLDALRASERYCAPLGDALLRLSAEVRSDRRRRAEAAVRRVPVRLLFPLVTCVLPAFALLTVAPLLAGTFGSLRL